MPTQEVLDVAQQLYEAYCNHTQWKSAVTGADLPQWHAVKTPVFEAWLATAVAAIKILKVS